MDILRWLRDVSHAYICSVHLTFEGSFIRFVPSKRASHNHFPLARSSSWPITCDPLHITLHKTQSIIRLKQLSSVDMVAVEHKQNAWKLRIKKR